MDKIEGLFVVLTEEDDAYYDVEGPFVYELAVEFKHIFTEQGKDCKIAKLTFLD